MTGTIRTYGGASYQLPELLKWRVCHSAGGACGDYEVSFLYNEKLYAALDAATRFSAQFSGQTVFTGVVDEFTIKTEARGTVCTLSGRSMAALLLDNEVGAEAYATARIEDIIKKYVQPTGIQTIINARLPALEMYSVAAGNSMYGALADFVYYGAGLHPWFDADGRLIIGSPLKYKYVRLGEGVTASYRDKRYGVVSHVNYMGTVFSGSFAGEGGIRTKYIAEIGKNSYKTGDRLAQLALYATAAERRTLTVTVPKAFAAMPYDYVQVKGFDPRGSGWYQVAGAESTGSPSGQICVLALR